MKKSNKIFWLFLAPSLIPFVIVVIIPLIVGIYYSFTDWNGISSSNNFVGFKNYIDIFVKDKKFIKAFLFTLKYAITAVIITNLGAFLLALLVTQKLNVSNFLKSAFFMPNLIGGILLGLIWQFIFTKGFPEIAKMTGLEFFNGWLSTPTTGFWGIVIVCSWQSIGYMMLIYVAGIQSIDKSVLEATKIDGANYFTKLFKITIPLIMPSITISLFMTISSSFKIFDQNLSLTGGGPYNSTQMVTLDIYNTAFVHSNLGLSQAKAILLVLVICAITFIQLYITKKREVEM